MSAKYVAVSHAGSAASTLAAGHVVSIVTPHSSSLRLSGATAFALFRSALSSMYFSVRGKEELSMTHNLETVHVFWIPIWQGPGRVSSLLESRWGPWLSMQFQESTKPAWLWAGEQSAVACVTLQRELQWVGHHLSSLRWGPPGLPCSYPLSSLLRSVFASLPSAFVTCIACDRSVPFSMLLWNVAKSCFYVSCWLDRWLMHTFTTVTAMCHVFSPGTIPCLPLRFSCPLSVLPQFPYFYHSTCHAPNSHFGLEPRAYRSYQLRYMKWVMFDPFSTIELFHIILTSIYLPALLKY